MSYYCKPGIMGIVRSHMISLAPYFFPLFTILLSALYLFVKPNSPGYISGSFFASTKCKFLFFMIGFAYSYHIIMFLKDARPSQSDFNHLGFFYGLTFVVFVQTVFLVMILLLLTQDYEGHKILLEDVEIHPNPYIDIEDEEGVDGPEGGARIEEKLRCARDVSDDHQVVGRQHDSF